jgi:chorismate dehydratase
VKLGYIDYLNCYPFYYHMFEREQIDGVQVLSGYPSDLNRAVVASELDMSPISAATCADIHSEIALLPDFCLSSVGYVGSVVLRCKVPIEELHRATVGVSGASYTSTVLLKIILQHYYGVEPVYRTTDPNPVLDGIDAALVIGNEAMIASREPISYSYDLGELWLRKTGFPAVFAVFAVREEVVETYSSQICRVVRSYRDSLRCLETEKEGVIAAARAKYPDITYDINAYYGSLQFEFTEELKNALMFYLNLAGELGFLNVGTQLRYLRFDGDMPQLTGDPGR